MNSGAPCGTPTGHTSPTRGPSVRMQVRRDLRRTWKGCGESTWNSAEGTLVKKPKTLETKLRSAIRLIWSRSPERRAIIKSALDNDKAFICPLCGKNYPDWAGEVDHEPPIGTLESWHDVESFINKMFFGPQRLVCKSCHRLKTKAQRKKR